jgi:adenine-specific DNA-methyltransferase
MASTSHWLARNPATKNSVDATIVAEWHVEASAYVQLAVSRGIRSDILFDEFECDGARSRDLVMQLMAACPLPGTAEPASLGAIHEFLVSRREHVSARSARGSCERHSSTSRKSGGVFYTPSYVIDYIVHQTLGPRLKFANPDQVEHLGVLDPAAGCGAFLLASYRYLSDWYLRWFSAHQPDRWSDDVRFTERGWQLTPARRRRILINNLFGVDLDAAAIEIARRSLWLSILGESTENTCVESTDFHGNHLASNLKHGHALIGTPFGDLAPATVIPTASDTSRRFVWPDEFPRVATRGGFDVVVGNPPYRRERDFKQQLDEIAKTALGRYRSPRMDLWYYFVHRGIELLRGDGTMSFITNAYWVHGTGAGKLIATLRDDVHLDELFLLRNQPVFQGVSAQHVLFSLTKSTSEEPTTIKLVPRELSSSACPFVTGAATVRQFIKTKEQLFVQGRINVWPSADRLLDKLQACPRLIELGLVRQGIAENPATINLRTIDRFQDEPAARHWKSGEGVFSLRDEEVQRLGLGPDEIELLRPYHELADLGRYWSAARPSRQLIYSTRQTCSEIADFPGLRSHLKRFRAILEARRETRNGSNRWWHLHWPRDEKIWQANKLVALQMAIRPSVVPTFVPTYVSFSTNVFVPFENTREDLRYLCALLNSRLLWSWFEHHGKHRGIGLELNGHVLAQAPVRRIDFDNPEDVRYHAELIRLVNERLRQQRRRAARGKAENGKILNAIAATEMRIDAIVATLYRLDADDVEFIDDLTRDGRE